MSDENDTLADYWRDVRPHMKEASRRRRDANRRTGRGKLEAARVSFVVKNEGAHLIVLDRWDYWPGTGLWIDRQTKRQGRGVHSLLVALALPRVSA